MNGSDEQEDFWADLIPLIRARQVVPVLGDDLLAVPQPDGTLDPFYQLVADELFLRHRLERPRTAEDLHVRPHAVLNDVACMLARAGRRRVEECYIPVHEALRAMLHKHRAQVELPYRQIAAIDDFRLFVTTTPDDALATAIDAVRYEGRAETQHIEYAPSNLPKDRLTDLASEWREEDSAVFYLFGKMAVLPVFTIHDEDILEFIYGLQTGLGPMPQRLFSRIRNANLLLIGCHFPDWIARFLLRVTKRLEERLSDTRRKRDFIIDPSANDQSEFVMFVNNFARSTCVLPYDPRQFVTDLARRWAASKADDEPRAGTHASSSPREVQRADIFISYSRTDLVAARTLHEELQRLAGGGAIAWLDKENVRPGDPWGSRVSEAIQGCRLFLPVVSHSEETRTEGEFIREWNLARDRSLKIDRRRFIVPVCIDADATDGSLGEYERAQRLFGNLDFGFAPGGRLTPPLKDMLVREIREIR